MRWSIKVLAKNSLRLKSLKAGQTHEVPQVAAVMSGLCDKMLVHNVYESTKMHQMKDVVSDNKYRYAILSC